MRETCGRTIAFVLAAHADEGDMRASVEAARAAHMPAVFLLAGAESAEAATEVVRTVRGGRRSTLVQAFEFDGAAAVDATRGAADFEFCGISYGLLETARVLAESVLDAYEALVVMDAAMNEVTEGHLHEVCRALREHPDAEAVASWIQSLRRPPFVFSRAFLEGLGASPLTRRASDGARTVPVVRTLDHLFGEERLAAPDTVPERVSHFLDHCTITALQALDLARHVHVHPGDRLAAPNRPPSPAGPSGPTGLGSADALLVGIAHEVLEREEGFSADEAAELAWADAFGARNRRDFPLLCDRRHKGRLAYLDSAATAQRVDVALRAQRDFDERENANVYRGAYELSANATSMFDAARERIEDFIGAGRRTTVLTANTSASCNLVAQAWGEWHIGEGDLIAVPLAEHHSNMLPFLMLAERKGARVVYVPYDEGGRIDKTAYREMLEAGGVKLVALAQVGNVFGIVEPVREMADAAHAHGARVLVDAAQSLPHVRIDVREFGADWVAFSGHKAYGPLGIGGLWISDEAFSEMDPRGGGGGTVSHVGAGSYYLRPKALQYEPGTPPISQAVGLAAALGYLDALGMENVARHQAALTRELVAGLSAIDGANVIGDHAQPDGQAGLVSFTVRSVGPASLAHFLGALGVAIRAGGHCALPLHASMGLVGTGRVSVGVYTTCDDIRAALVAVEACRRAYEA